MTLNIRTVNGGHHFTLKYGERFIAEWFPTRAELWEGVCLGMVQLTLPVEALV